MDTKKEVNKYLNKYFKEQYINENDDEFKSLVRLLNKVQKAVKNCSIPVVVNCSNCDSTNIIKEDIYRCKNCNCFHGKNGEQL